MDTIVNRSARLFKMGRPDAYRQGHEVVVEGAREGHRRRGRTRCAAAQRTATGDDEHEFVDIDE